MSEKDLLETLERWSPGKVKEALADLEASGRAQVVQRYGVRFWSAAPFHYPGETESRAADPRKRRRQPRPAEGERPVTE